MNTELNEITRLEIEFNKLLNLSNLEMIKFYERNLELIERIEVNNNINKYNTKLRFDFEYGISLIENGQNKKGIEVLEKALYMLEKNPDLNFKAEFQSSEYFEKVLWNFGYALFKINRINKALLIFKELKQKFSKEKYKSWEIAMNCKRLEKIVNIITNLVLLWTILTFTWFKTFEPKIRFNLAIGLFVFVIIGVSIHIYNRKLKKKNTNAQHRV